MLNKNILSIDFDSNQIKVVEGRYSKKGIVVNNSYSIELPKDLYIDGHIHDMDHLTYLLKNGIPSKKIAKSNAYGVINSSRIIMREVSIPKVDGSQIEAILKYQLEDYMPVNPEEYIVKHLVTGVVQDEGTEKINLLLIGVPVDLVEGHFKLFKNVGLKPIVLDYAGNAISKLINFSELINNIYVYESTVACINLGYNSTSLNISKKGKIEVSRIIDVDKNNIMLNLMEKLDNLNENEILDRLFNLKSINYDYDSSSEEFIIVEAIKEKYRYLLYQIEMILRYFKAKEVDNELDLVIIHGDMSAINGTEELFSSYFDKPCIRLNTLNKVKFAGDLSKFAIAIGGLIRVSEVK
jgi:type IV pilus assembly protein PilM